MSDLLAGRVLTFAELVEMDPEPLSWRCGGFVADGTLTVLAGRAGSGKTWLGAGLALGVARGEPVAGIDCERGTAAIVDFEQGRRLTALRARSAGWSGDALAAVTHIDAGRLDLANDAHREELASQLVKEDGSKRFDYVLWDSLKRATPTLGESDNDEMAGVVGMLAGLAHDLNIASVLIHHRGRDDRKLFRGATAIMDQTDALFGLVPVGNADEDESDERRLTCRGEWGKPPRYAEPPEDRYMRVDVEQGGIVAAESPRLAKRRDYEAAILEQLPFTGTKRELAELCGASASNDAWRKVFDALDITKAKGTFYLMPDINATADQPAI